LPQIAPRLGLWRRLPADGSSPRQSYSIGDGLLRRGPPHREQRLVGGRVDHPQAEKPPKSSGNFIAAVMPDRAQLLVRAECCVPGRARQAHPQLLAGQAGETARRTKTKSLQISSRGSVSSVPESRRPHRRSCRGRRVVEISVSPAPRLISVTLTEISFSERNEK